MSTISQQANSEYVREYRAQETRHLKVVREMVQEISGLKIKLEIAQRASHPPLKWSSEKPKVAGFYWFKHEGSGNINIGKVDEYMDFSASGIRWSVAHLPGQWSGPLPPPEE